MAPRACPQDLIEPDGSQSFPAEEPPHPCTQHHLRHRGSHRVDLKTASGATKRTFLSYVELEILDITLHRYLGMYVYIIYICRYLYI